VLKFDGSFDELISIHQRIIENETMGIKNINLVLFRTITPYVSNITEPYALKNIIGNIIVFIPLGFLTSQLLVERCRKPIIMCVLIIVFIECMQLIFKIGFFDVDDIFLNLLGCLSGICISLFLNNTDKNKGE
jgi:glycopeptide antibiotics resistance protein